MLEVDRRSGVQRNNEHAWTDTIQTHWEVRYSVHQRPGVTNAAKSEPSGQLIRYLYQCANADQDASVSWNWKICSLDEQTWSELQPVLNWTDSGFYFRRSDSQVNCTVGERKRYALPGGLKNRRKAVQFKCGKGTLLQRSFPTCF